MRIQLGNALTVARWEFIRTIKSPTFIILTLVIPLIMLVSGGLSVITGRAAASEPLNLGVIDLVGDFHPVLEGELESAPAGLQVHDVASGEEAARDSVIAGDLDAYVIIDESSLAESTLTVQTGDRMEARSSIANMVLSRAVTNYRLLQMGLSGEEVAQATEEVRVRTVSIDADRAEDVWIGEMIVPMVVAMGLIFSTVFSGQMMMYGVIKEKRNRIVEILLSSVSSLDLLTGKLLGFGLLGLMQIFLWAGIGLVVALRFFDLSGILPSVGDGLIYLFYFVFGYLLIASLFAALGATMKDAEGGGQVQGLVILIPMLPVFLAGPMVASPNALWARLLSHIPPFIPSTVLLRMAGTNLPTWEIFTTGAMLMASVVAFVYLSARIFQGGILRFERATTLAEATRMARGNTD